MQDLINATMPATVVSDVTAHLNAVIIALKPYTTGLTAAQREELPKMGDKSTAYIEKVADYFDTHPDYIPKRVNATAFSSDFTLNKTLSPLRSLARTVFQMLDDTMMATGSDMMDAGGAYYHSVSDAAEDGDAAAKTVYEELKKRYPSIPRRGAAPKTDPPA